MRNPFSIHPGYTTGENPVSYNQYLGPTTRFPQNTISTNEKTIFEPLEQFTRQFFQASQGAPQKNRRLPPRSSLLPMHSLARRRVLTQPLSEAMRWHDDRQFFRGG
jgi:hypothetical protein